MSCPVSKVGQSHLRHATFGLLLPFPSCRDYYESVKATIPVMAGGDVCREPFLILGGPIKAPTYIPSCQDAVKSCQGASLEIGCFPDPAFEFSTFPLFIF